MSGARHAGTAHVSLGGSEGYNRAEAAVRTLERMGYTHKGGREWAPPLGSAPCTPESHAKPRVVWLADECFPEHGGPSSKTGFDYCPKGWRVRGVGS